MAIFKNIKDIKTSEIPSAFGKDYLNRCKEKINDGLKNFYKNKNAIYDMWIHSSYYNVGYIHKYYDVLYITYVGNIDRVNDICFSENNDIEVILHVFRNPEHARIMNNTIILDYDFYRNIEITIKFLKFLFSPLGLEKVFDIKKSIYDFKFKIDVSDTPMSGSGYIEFYGDSGDRSSCLLMPYYNVYMKSLVNMVKTYFVNYSKEYIRVVYIKNPDFENLNEFFYLGKLFKTKEVCIKYSEYKERHKISLSGIEHILIDNGKLYIEDTDPRYILDYQELKDLALKYRVNYDYLLKQSF